MLKQLKLLLNNTDVIKVLIDEFAKFARLPVTELSLCQLNDLVEQVLNDYQSKSRAAKISFCPQANLPLVALDVVQFRRCITNLVDNALSAVSEVENPKIQIATSYDDGRMINLEVADNGTGINTVDRARIFDPYFTNKQEGSGLGLAIVANIIADHQGSIKVFDNQPQGSRFIIELPADANKEQVRYGA